jgi:fructose-1,6-bisphosphatase/inositol monophosphatase family enzyme
VRDRPPAARRVALDPATRPLTQHELWESIRTAAAETCAEVAPRGSIALGLAHVAAGIFDGFVQFGGSPVQDFAAGTLLVREAGGS